MGAWIADSEGTLPFQLPLYAVSPLWNSWMAATRHESSPPLVIMRGLLEANRLCVSYVCYSSILSGCLATHRRSRSELLLD